MARKVRRTASQVFQRVWDALDERRIAKGIRPETIAARCGFRRAAWYAYQAKGTIPFHFLERVAQYLEASIEANVVGRATVRNGTPPPASLSGGVMDHIERFRELLEQVPEEQRDFAAGAAYNAAESAVQRLSFEGAAAEKGAARGRKKK